MCEEIEKMKKAERIKIAQRIISSEKFTYGDSIFYQSYFGENQDSDK